jgi:ligand-binding sensor domain-containing protein
MAGLNKLDRVNRQFTRYQHDPDDPNSLSHNIVLSVVEDSTGVLWVATEGGLNRFDPKTEQFIHFRHDPDDPSSLSHNSVKSISGDSSGNLWVGTDGGICKFNPETTRFTRYQHDPDDPQTLSKNLVAAVYVDRAGKLWGQLTLRHHGIHKLSDRSLKAQTIVHNYYRRNRDGTTPAERFFEAKHIDFFQWLLEKMDFANV